jgi:signal transduction histidine kinase
MDGPVPVTAAADIADMIRPHALRMRHLTDQRDVRLEERMRIARELHDTLLQGVLSVSMQLHVAIDQLRVDDPAKPLFSRVQQLLRQLAEDGRNTVRGFRTCRTDAQGLEQALAAVPTELGDTSDVNFRVSTQGMTRSLHPVIRDEIYWIGREALLNALRHSGARQIELELCYGARHLRLLIRDDGSGIDPQVRARGPLGCCRNA